MKMSFSIKLGILMIFLLTSLMGSILWYFYNYSKSLTMEDFRQTIADVTHTGSFILDENARVSLTDLKRKLEETLPENFNERVLSFANTNSEGQFKEVLASDKSSSLQNSAEFVTLVQLLRRVQAGSQPSINALDTMAQTDMVIDCQMSPSELVANNADRSSVRWSYLLVPIPGIATSSALMFLADSNFMGPANEVSNPIGNVYLPRAVFTEPFRTGKMAISDWYKDEFDACVSVMTAAVPIKSENGEIIAILGADYPVTKFEERIASLTANSRKIFLVTMTIALLMTFVIAFWISVPLSRLKAGAEQLSKKDFEHKVMIRSQDEFGVIAKTMNQVSQTMKEFTQNLEELVAKRTHALSAATKKVQVLNARLESENAFLGAEVDSLLRLRQYGLPHAGQTVNLGNYKVMFEYIGSTLVCGDFWALVNGKKHQQLSYGQVSGYGLETATTVMQLQAILQNQVSGDACADIEGCHRFISSVNGMHKPALMAKLFSVQMTDSVITITGSGMPPLKFSSKSVEEINIEGSTPIGLRGSMSGAPTTISLSDEESILLYSAGFRRAICSLHQCRDDGIDDQHFIQLTGLINDTPEILRAKLLDSVWSETWQDDISFVLIQKRLTS